MLRDQVYKGCPQTLSIKCEEVTYLFTHIVILSLLRQGCHTFVLLWALWKSRYKKTSTKIRLHCCALAAKYFNW